MAMPPHVVKKIIDAMPDGPEKEKKLKSFNRQLKICMIAQLVMLGVMGIVVVVTVYIFFMRNMGA